MPNSPVYEGGLRDKLRRLIKDTAWTYPQFTFQVTGGTACTVEVTDNHFITVGTGVPSVDFVLTNTGYETIELLVSALRNADATYQVTLIEDGNPNHVSNDLGLIGPTDCFAQSVVFRTRRWSDEEFDDVLQNAIDRHAIVLPPDKYYNWQPPYTVATVPANHHYLILLLAQIEVLKMQMADSTRRRGLELQPEQFVTLKQALEDEYRNSIESLTRRNAERHPEDTEDLGSGNIIQGQFYRRKPGEFFVMGANAPYPLPTTVDAEALGSGKTLLRWKPSIQQEFYKYEIWRGTTVAVSNEHLYVRPQGSVTATGELVKTIWDRNSTRWVDGVENTVTPGAYYYRIYTFNRGGLYSGSAPIPVTVA